MLCTCFGKLKTRKGTIAIFSLALKLKQKYTFIFCSICKKYKDCSKKCQKKSRIVWMATYSLSHAVDKLLVVPT